MALSRKELAADYAATIKFANNEAAKKEIFVSFLTSLFEGSDEYGIIPPFTSVAEKRITNISRVGHVSEHGMADTPVWECHH